MALLDIVKKGYYSILTESGYVKFLPRTLASLVNTDDGSTVESKITELDSNLLTCTNNLDGLTFKTDLLSVDLNNPNSSLNKVHKVVADDASTLVNSPVASGIFVAKWECIWYEVNRVLVTVTEFYPQHGRVWKNHYNTAGTGWVGWSLGASDTATTLTETLPVSKGGTGATTAKAARTNIGALGSSDVVDNVTSTSTTLPLSAKQGKSLQDQITTLNSNKMDKGSKFSTANGKAQMWEDSEGGNIQIISPKGVVWEIDAYNGDLRFFHLDPVINSLVLHRDGSFSTGNSEATRQHLGVMGAKNVNGYWGIMQPDGNDVEYIRTPKNGIIPYDTTVQSSVGTSNFPFLCGHFRYLQNVANISFWGNGLIWNEVNQQLYIKASDQSEYQLFFGVREDKWTLCPHTHDFLILGAPSYRWNCIFANNGTIQTSDRNAKDDIKELTDTHLEFFSKLIPVSFKMKEGTSGRTHIGFISQDVEQAMSECGLTDLDFAGFCKDPKTVLVEKTKTEVKVNPETGEEESVEVEYTEDVPVEGEYVYSLRYDEFIGLVTQATQVALKKIECLEGKIESLESWKKSIEERLSMLE